MPGGPDQPKRHGLERGAAEGVTHLQQDRVRGDETAAGERELAAHRHGLVVPIVLLVAEGDEGCRIDKDLAHSQDAQVVVVALGEIADAGVHRHRIDLFQQLPPLVLAQAPVQGLGEQTDDELLRIR